MWKKNSLSCGFRYYIRSNSGVSWYSNFETFFFFPSFVWPTISYPILFHETKFWNWTPFGQTFKVSISQISHSPNKQPLTCHNEVSGFGQIIDVHKVVRPEKVEEVVMHVFAINVPSCYHYKLHHICSYNLCECHFLGITFHSVHVATPSTLCAFGSSMYSKSSISIWTKASMLETMRTLLELLDVWLWKL